MRNTRVPPARVDGVLGGVYFTLERVGGQSRGTRYPRCSARWESSVTRCRCDGWSGRRAQRRLGDARGLIWSLGATRLADRFGRDSCGGRRVADGASLRDNTSLPFCLAATARPANSVISHPYCRAMVLCMPRRHCCLIGRYDSEEEFAILRAMTLLH